MLNRKIRNLAVTGITIMAALTALGATGASAATTAAANSGPAHIAGQDVPAITSAAATFKIYQHDGLCLGITGGNSDAPAVQWTCIAHPDQTWHWGSANAAGFEQLINASGQCLGVAGESTSYEARVVGWTCNGHPDQYWYPVSVGSYLGFEDYNSGLFLTVDQGSTQNGAGIVQWGWRGYTNQLWY